MVYANISNIDYKVIPNMQKLQVERKLKIQRKRKGKKHTFRGLIPAAATYMSSFPIGIPMP